MSAGIAALIAHVGFWVLLAYGWFWDEVGSRGVAVFLLLWIGGMFALRLVPYGDAMFPSFVALLDVALVFIIFKGDVRLT
jgi:hypothetical protein